MDNGTMDLGTWENMHLPCHKYTALIHRWNLTERTNYPLTERTDFRRWPKRTERPELTLDGSTRHGQSHGDERPPSYESPGTGRLTDPRRFTTEPFASLTIIESSIYADTPTTRPGDVSAIFAPLTYLTVH